MKGNDVSATTRLRAILLLKQGMKQQVIADRLGLSLSSVVRIAAQERRKQRLTEVLSE